VVSVVMESGRPSVRQKKVVGEPPANHDAVRAIPNVSRPRIPPA
jgi:hypothetical protein